MAETPRLNGVIRALEQGKTAFVGFGSVDIETASALAASNLDPELVSQVLEPSTGSSLVINEGARAALAGAISLVFLFAFILAAFALSSVFLAPNKDLKEKPLAEESPVMVSAD